MKLVGVALAALVFAAVPTAAERYREVLPRWMREGTQSERRGGSKRRP